MSDVEAVKSRLDIVDVVGGYVTLRRAGRSYKGLCPFHKEKTSSFIVTPDLQIFKCFGCGEAGDVLNFIQKIERVDFGEALKIGAEKSGYTLTERGQAKDPKLEKQKARLYELNDLASKYWHYVLNTHNAGKPGRDYQEKRLIRHQESEKFQLGYAPMGTNLVPFLQKKGFSAQELITAGLAVERNGKVMDKFRDRFILPIWDMRGNIVGFSGRIVTPNEYAPKYLNSPETLVYHKSEILMGLYQAKEAARANNFLILEEGNIDLMSSHRVGVENIVASGGTALTIDQCKLIKRHADSVYLCFDTDAAGIKATLKGLELAEITGLKHKVIDIGDFKDPDELIAKEPKAWAELIKEPINTIAFFLKIYQKDLDMGSADDKSAFLQRMIPVLQVLKDPVQVQHFAEEVAVLVGITKQDVLNSLTQSNKRVRAKELVAETEPEKLANPANASAVNNREQYLLALLLQMQNMHEVEVSGEVFADVNCKEVFTKLMQHAEHISDFPKFASELSDGATETLQQILAIEFQVDADLEKEFHRIYRTLYITYLRAQVLNLRMKLQSDPEDEAALSKLQYFSGELKSLS